eukprot:gnl/TRDRNA2_/TRDRNA2_176108_c0_seq21.p1 gnl/TRDRNA2_/TRDRNA2_176108_c0~~gnl/TRDRNA2_/TRDRNA2_176108_c0_seq21.p1  ORF type:complete len:194 (+),score=54.70 gnl/TRDRNA2_/TRDRNA2_176108_c0_seq21:57-638(+)
MGMLKGIPVELDNLFEIRLSGFSKLKDFLSLIVEHLNEQDTTITKLREDLDVSASRVAEQDAICERAKKDVDHISTISVKIAELEEKLKNAFSTETIDAMQKQINSFVNSLEKAGQGQEGVELAQADAQKRLDSLQKELQGLKGEVDISKGLQSFAQDLETERKESAEAFAAKSEALGVRIGNLETLEESHFQ